MKKIRSFEEFDEVVKSRKETSIISSISDDRGEEVTYNKQSLSKLVEANASIGDVLTLLWFKKQPSKKFSGFLELVIISCADHGPAVSGAHNAIVASRAGKDLISCLCSGLLTIGPRFGGAIDDAAKNFYSAVTQGKRAFEFVCEMKEKGVLIPGIGHRVKSKSNPDKRVELLKNFALKNLSSSKHLEFALAVEKETLKKKSNLILNVDGCIAACMLDFMLESNFSCDEVEEYIEIGAFNALFAFSRSIGLIAHAIDQKRLKQGLYRHKTDDMLYL